GTAFSVAAGGNSRSSVPAGASPLDSNSSSAPFMTLRPDERRLEAADEGCLAALHKRRRECLRKLNGDNCTGAVHAAGNAYFGAVHFGNLAHDSQPQAAAADCRAQCAIEALEYALTFFRRNARSIVFDYQARIARIFQTDGDFTAALRIKNGILNKIDAKLVEVLGITENYRSAAGSFETEINSLCNRLRYKL